MLFCSYSVPWRRWAFVELDTVDHALACYKYYQTHSAIVWYSVVSLFFVFSFLFRSFFRSAQRVFVDISYLYTTLAYPAVERSSSSSSSSSSCSLPVPVGLYPQQPVSRDTLKRAKFELSVSGHKKIVDAVLDTGCECALVVPNGLAADLEIKTSQVCDHMLVPLTTSDFFLTASVPVTGVAGVAAAHTADDDIEVRFIHPTRGLLKRIVKASQGAC